MTIATACIPTDLPRVILMGATNRATIGGSPRGVPRPTFLKVLVGLLVGTKPDLSGLEARTLVSLWPPWAPVVPYHSSSKLAPLPALG